MDWLTLAVGEPAPFFSVPAVGYLSGAAPYSWGRPLCLLAGRHADGQEREAGLGVNAPAPAGPGSKPQT